jgi:hypothetical protein
VAVGHFFFNPQNMKCDGWILQNEEKHQTDKAG